MLVISDAFSKLIQENSLKAFEVLFKLYYDKLYHIAKSYIGNDEDAEEIVQDVFLKIWERRDKTETWTSGFIFTVLKNSCLDYLKHQKVVIKKKETFYDQQLSDPLRFVENETASLLLEKELELKIQESIAALPEMRRAVFVKSRMEGMKSKEIADELGISKRTVETHIYLAIRYMRNQLKEFLT